MSREIVILKLELIAAKAAQLASDYKNDRLWEGELQRGLGEIATQLRDAEQRAERR